MQECPTSRLPGWETGTSRASSPGASPNPGSQITRWLHPDVSPARMKYLLHRLVQDLLQVPHLDADHEGRGAADGVEQALGNHGDVGVSPGEGVEESSYCMDALRQDAAGQGASTARKGEFTSHLQLSCVLSSFKRFYFKINRSGLTSAPLPGK